MKSSRSTHILLAIACFFMTQNASGQYDPFQKVLKSEIVALDPKALAEGKPFDMHHAIDLNFKVLAIGEQSHGTSEFFKARVSLIQSLVHNGPINKIGLEAPMAEVEELNAYMMEGKGDLKQILASFRLFNYECHEFVGLVESVKLLNRSAGKQITFFGIDMQSPFQSLQNIAESCASTDQALADSAKKLTEYYQALNNQLYNHMISEADFAELSALSNQLFSKLEGKKPACPQTARIRSSITNYKQFLMLNDPKMAAPAQANLRDSLMAENTLHELNSNDKVVLLAHNGHVQKTPNTYSKSMGYFLSQKLGHRYQCIGLTTTSGFYTAFTPEAGRVTDKNEVPAAGSDTFESQFSKTGKPILFFKTSAVKEKLGGKTAPARYKLLPFGLTDKPFVDGNLLDDFDYVLHIEKTTGNRSFYLK